MFGITPPPGGSGDKGGKETRLLSTAIAVPAAFLLGPTIHRHTVDWVVGVALQTYPPDWMDAVNWAWFGLVHLLTFAAIRTPVFTALTIATVYTTARFAPWPTNPQASERRTHMAKDHKYPAEIRHIPGEKLRNHLLPLPPDAVGSPIWASRARPPRSGLPSGRSLFCSPGWRLR